VARAEVTAFSADQLQQTGYLRQAHIKKCQPILKGLQCETTQDQSDAEGPEPAFGQVIGEVFDVRNDRASDCGDNASYEAYSDREQPGVVDVTDECAADESGGNIADSALDRSPKLATAKTCTARRGVIDGRTHAARIGDYLADGNENGKCDCEFEAQNSIEPGSESEGANGGEQSFPRQRIVIQSTSCPIEFNRNSDTCRDTGS